MSESNPEAHDQGNSMQEAITAQSFFQKAPIRNCPAPLLTAYRSDCVCMANLHADGGSLTTRLHIHYCIEGDTYNFSSVAGLLHPRNKRCVNVKPKLLAFNCDAWV